MKKIQKDNSEISGNLDSPSNNQVIGAAFNIKGWVYSNSDNEITVNIYIDGDLVNSGFCEFPRFDIYQKYLTENSYLSGFMARIVINKLSSGLHNLEVIAENLEGRHVISKIKFIKNKKNILTKIFKKNTPDEFPLLGGAGPNMGKQKIIAERLLKNLINPGKLKPEHKVLDIGCGVGRVAIPLTKYLTSKGEYKGTDNVKESIDYANQQITPRFPNFQFYHADILSEMYNPKGKHRASEYKYEFDNSSFDFVFLTSVFTHMRFNDVKNYLNEIARMLKKGGRCFITYFILNDTTKKQMEMGLCERTFKYEHDGFYSDFEHLTEGAIAFEEKIVRKLYNDAGLTIEAPIHKGKWSGISGISYQDIIVAVKKQYDK